MVFVKMLLIYSIIQDDPTLIPLWASQAYFYITVFGTLGIIIIAGVDAKQKVLEEEEQKRSTARKREARKKNRYYLFIIQSGYVAIYNGDDVTINVIFKIPYAISDK